MERGKWCRGNLGIYIVFIEGVFRVDCQRN
jgi:hypothetical protein